MLYTAIPSVWLFVHLSVTREICVEMAKDMSVYCRFKQVNGITTATEITEDLMQITESTVITKNVHSC